MNIPTDPKTISRLKNILLGALCIEFVASAVWFANARGIISGLPGFGNQQSLSPDILLFTHPVMTVTGTVSEVKGMLLTVEVRSMDDPTAKPVPLTVDIQGAELNRQAYTAPPSSPAAAGTTTLPIRVSDLKRGNNITAVLKDDLRIRSKTAPRAVNILQLADPNVLVGTVIGTEDNILTFSGPVIAKTQGPKNKTLTYRATLTEQTRITSATDSAQILSPTELKPGRTVTVYFDGDVQTTVDAPVLGIVIQ